jgi:hypothetical protein
LNILYIKEWSQGFLGFFKANEKNIKQLKEIGKEEKNFGYKKELKVKLVEIVKQLIVVLIIIEI